MWHEAREVGIIFWWKFDCIFRHTNTHWAELSNMLLPRFDAVGRYERLVSDSRKLLIAAGLWDITKDALDDKNTKKVRHKKNMQYPTFVISPHVRCLRSTASLGIGANQLKTTGPRIIGGRKRHRRPRL